MESKTNKLRIKCVDEEEFKHPFCPHGPTLFFYTDDDVENGYFACSAFRDKRDCNFHLLAGKLAEYHLHKEYKQPLQEYRAMRQKVLNNASSYCHTCDLVLHTKELKDHVNHKQVRLTKTLLQDPTKFLQPAENDKAQAQYFFDEKSLKFFGNCFKDLGISKVLCVGAPRLHAYLQKHTDLNIKSYLLDFDHRFYYFYDEDSFAWYNMCNNHFFDDSQKSKFLMFLKNSTSDRTLIVTDPPFACRTEVIAKTLRDLTSLHNTVNQLPQQPLPIFWIFPYYMGQYIKNEMSGMEMCDYKVNYTNHAIYANNGNKENRKFGSPVRVFTNIPLHLLKLPVEEGYKYCSKCICYTALENRHCDLCNICPSKNGSSYRHCEMCGLCVKPNYVHCKNCRRCTQVEGHNCNEYQSKQRCWICREVGHIERNCKLWKKTCKKFILAAVEGENEKQIHCLICDRLGHNETKCPMRGVFIEENMFLGETMLRFK